MDIKRKVTALMCFWGWHDYEKRWQFKNGVYAAQVCRRCGRIK